MYAKCLAGTRPFGIPRAKSVTAMIAVRAFVGCRPSPPCHRKSGSRSALGRSESARTPIAVAFREKVRKRGFFSHDGQNDSSQPSIRSAQRVDATIHGRSKSERNIRRLTFNSILVEEQLGLSPFGPQLFVFCNRKRDKLKILYWERSGFVLWYKRLENPQPRGTGTPRPRQRDASSPVCQSLEQQSHRLRYVAP